MTERQARFAEVLMTYSPEIRYCATRAARAVGYKWPEKQGPRLCTFPEVAAVIKAKLKVVADEQERFRVQQRQDIDARCKRRSNCM